ncbi:hypothetical protein SynA1562_00600 [Synechococcus sp. A15-62]|nr:hypothetical protein SynA1562_00600 [Synechococcus sp. A15-62]
MTGACTTPQKQKDGFTNHKADDIQVSFCILDADIVSS